MKERADADYVVELDRPLVPPEVTALLSDTYDIRLNGLVSIAVLPWFPRGPWPEELPLEPEEIVDRRSAAWYAARMSRVVVAPAEDGVEAWEVEVRKDVDGMRTTMCWLTPDAHRRIVSEIVERLGRRSGQPGGRSTRLSELDGTALGAFLTEKVPRAELSAYARSILCLP